MGETPARDIFSVRYILTFQTPWPQYVPPKYSEIDPLHILIVYSTLMRPYSNWSNEQS